jgi:hypothetical protein
VLEERVDRAALPHKRPRDERGHAEAELLEAGLVVDRRGRRHVIVEAAVLVVREHEEAPAPVRALRERREHARYEGLAELDIVVGVVVVRARAEELRVDD